MTGKGSEMAREGNDMMGLDDLLATARAQAPAPSDALMARVLQDALAHQPRAVVSPAIVTAPRGLAARISDFMGALGGRLGVAGLGTATLAGIWLGFAQPAPVAAMTGLFMTEVPLDEVDLIPGTDDFLTEG